MKMRTAVAALVTVSFLATPFAASAESVVPTQPRIPYFNSALEGGPAMVRIDADGGGGGGGGGVVTGGGVSGAVDPIRPRNTLTPSKPANPAVQRELTNKVMGTGTGGELNPAVSGVAVTGGINTPATTDGGTAGDPGSVPLIISADPGNDGSTITATTDGSGAITTTTATIAGSTGNSNVSAASIGNLNTNTGNQIFNTAQSIGQGIAVGAATLAATGLLSQLIKTSTPDMSTAPAMSPAAATSAANTAASSPANTTPQTLEGQRDIASGACNPEDLGRLNADAEARTALTVQRQQDIILQVSNMPSVDVLACTSRTGANITAAVDALFQSSGFAQRFFDVSIMRNIQISVGSSPVAQALIAPFNAVLSTTMTAVVNSLQATVSKAIGSAIGKALGGKGSTLAGDLNNLFGGTGLRFVQAASDNCQQQRMAYERARACISRLMKNGYTATSAQDCLDRAGIQATALAGGSAVNPQKTAAASTAAATDRPGGFVTDIETGEVRSVGPGID